MTTKPNCWKCKFVGDNPGNAHARCLHPLVKGKMKGNPLGEILAIFASVGRCAPVIEAEKAKALGITLDPHGVKKGWANWPWNFDPVWLLSCGGFIQKED